MPFYFVHIFENIQTGFDGYFAFVVVFVCGWINGIDREKWQLKDHRSIG